MGQAHTHPHKHAEKLGACRPVDATGLITGSKSDVISSHTIIMH